MFNFPQLFPSLAKLCGSSISTDIPDGVSSFHLLQDAATEKLREDQDDVILWDSGAPIPILLGKPTNDKLDPIRGSVLLIASNTAAMSSDAILESDIDTESLKSASCIFNAIGKIWNAEMAIFNQDIKKMITDVIPKIAQLENKDSLKEINKVAKCIQNNVFSMFHPKSIFGDFVFLIIQFFVTLQSYGLFELASTKFEEFSNLESITLKSFNKLYEKDGEKAIELLKELKNKLMKILNNIAKDKYMSKFLIFYCKCLIQYVHQILRLIKRMLSGFVFDKFTIKENRALPSEFSDSFLSILSTDKVEHEYVKQLALALNSYSDEPIIQYICSCAACYEKEIMGCSSLLSSLMSFTPSKELEHLSKLLGIIPNIFSKMSNEFNDLISKEKLTDVNKTLEIMFKGISKKVSTPAEALHCITIYTNFQPYFSESKNLKTFNLSYNNIVKISLAWIISISKLVRLLEINLVRATVDIIDIQYNIENDLKMILDNFNKFSQYELNLLDFYQISSMMKNIVEINKLIFPKLEDIEKTSFISFAKFIPNFQNIINLTSLFNLYFGGLQECFKFNIKHNGGLLQHNGKILCQKINCQIDNLLTAISSQPDYISSLVSDIVFQCFHFNIQVNSLKNNLSDFSLILHKLSKSITQKDKLTEISKQLRLALQNVLQELLSTTDDINILHKTRLSNKDEVSRLIERIELQEMKEETIYEIKSIYENPKYKHEQKKIEVNLKKIIDMRMKNEYPIEISKITQLNEKEIFDNSLTIAAMIPLYAGKNLEVIQKQIAPLILHNSPTEVHQIVRNTLIQYTFSAPLILELNTIITEIINGETNIDEKIQAIANKFNITNLPAVKSDDQENIFYQLLTLLAYSKIAQEGPFSEDKIRNWVKIIDNKRSSHEEIKSTINEVLKSSLLTAMTTNTYDIQLMYKYQFVYSACESYLNNPTDYNRRSLIASICLLPTEMNQTSEITMDWGTAVALLNPSSINKLVDISDIDFYQYISDVYPLPVKPQNVSNVSSHSSSIFSVSRANSMLSSDQKLSLISPGDMSDVYDDEPYVIYQDVIEEEEVGEAEVIEEIEEVFVEEDEDEEPINLNIIDDVYVYNLVLQVLDVYSKLCETSKSIETSAIKFVYEQLYYLLMELSNSVSKEKEKIISLLTTIKETIMKIDNDDHPETQDLSKHRKYFESLLREPQIQDKIYFLHSLTKDLLEKMDYPSEDILICLDPLRRSIVINTPDIMNTIKRIINHLKEHSKHIKDKYTIHSIEELNNCIVSLYLLHHMFEYQDHELDIKCVSACRRIETILHLLLTNLKCNKEITNFQIFESLYNDIIEKLNNLLSNSDKSIIEFPNFGKDILLEHATKRFNAYALEYKRKKEVEEAELEVKRLNEVD